MNYLTDNIEHREIRNLNQYSHLWGESCPKSELPYLIVFRGHDFDVAIDELILKERAANQRHWVRGLRNALKPLQPEQKENAGQIKRVLSVIEAMEAEAERYDTTGEA